MQGKNSTKKYERTKGMLKITILVKNSFRNSYLNYQFEEFQKIKVNMSYVNGIN